jgi:hypothetical protein
VILFSFYIYAVVAFDTMFQFPALRQKALHGLNLIDRMPAGPFSISLHSLTGMLSTLTLAIIILRRSANMSRRQAQLEGELAAAQEVQRVLVPEPMSPLSRLVAISSRYFRTERRASSSLLAMSREKACLPRCWSLCWLARFAGWRSLQRIRPNCYQI